MYRQSGTTIGLVHERTGNDTRLAAPMGAAQCRRGNTSRRRPDDRPPGEVNSALPLESEFGVFEAPLEDYDVVELTRFDRPLARAGWLSAMVSLWWARCAQWTATLWRSITRL
ncbi:hypothetical protein AHiyo8_07920 [Arthrobacter sp. Hiyo8]|nr:hypothetical protein AHiyo8_07920 [Arthrobacter sp. Hiyo8]